MAKIPNGVEALPKVRAHERYRQTDRRQTDGRQHIANVNVTSRSLKLGVLLIPHRSESEWTVLLGYLTISTNVRRYYCVVCNNFVVQQDNAPVHLAFNTVQLLQCKTLNFFFSPSYAPLTVKSLTQLTIFRESYRSMSMSCN